MHRYGDVEELIRCDLIASRPLHFQYAYRCIGNGVVFYAVSHQSPASFEITFVRAIFAGWLIALMVWLLPAEASRFSVIVLLTYLIGLGNFNHMVAGSNKIFFLIANQAENWSVYAHSFFLPTLLGNIIGGVSLVAFLNHAQVVAGKEASHVEKGEK